MSLDPQYLEYPMRRKGMDHDLYEWSAIHERAPLALPGGAKMAVALLVSLEWFPIVPGEAPFKAPGHMLTAYPDFRHYTAREYGTRVGFYRLLDAFGKAGAKATIAVNAAIAERYPTIIDDIVAAGHEIVAHSTDMDGTIDGSLDEAAERALIRKSRDTLAAATGSAPKGWMSLARSQSWNTPRLLVEEGFAYALDWVNDDLPYRQTTPAGTLVNVPYNHELSDRQIIVTQQHSADSYVEQMQDAYRWLAGEAAPRVLPLHLTPYVMGLPFRMGAFERLLGWLAEQPQSAFLTAGDLCAALPEKAPE
ncbi:polysaccharide deacetylase [Novosphingobium sp. PC22D]|uniref:polysaccharide deacetylase family protein n=1 Tax=Novosphingobium sp. PC22D TaxID=1962403 RepID=UPI000BEFD946|nr:polysaccharide deacetylase family protein [Novosphingobium sp. PC22D]PEQ11375.1 polysaccharide deacetylase [Novosphingobium sp. PC22D]